MAKPKYQTLSGMYDILPQDRKYFRKILRTVKDISEFYGFKRIETPILEKSGLFEKSTGASTDIVEKQMYEFKTKGGDSITLRPEGTPPIVRAYIEHGMKSWPQPAKLWHLGPYFRYERPQAGRNRQFWQFGLETIGAGAEDPIVDAETIQIFYKILEKLKFENLIVEINSIGDSKCRPYYKKLLKNYLEPHLSELCPDCKRRFKKNPLRILDCKEKMCRGIINQAPQIIDHLCKKCHRHFKKTLEFLDQIEIPYHLNPYLVRGLDYYTRTVFEIVGNHQKENDPPSLSLIGGGRYNNLVKILGGEETPGFGGAAGMDRIVELIKDKPVRLGGKRSPKLFLAQLGKKPKGESLKLVEKFREANISIAQAISKDSLKSQLKLADKIGVKYTLILGHKELTQDKIIVRNMETGKQRTLRLKNITKKMKKRI